MGMTLGLVTTAAPIVGTDMAVGYGVGEAAKALDVGSNVLTPWMPATYDVGVALSEGQDIATAVPNAVLQDVQVGAGALAGASMGGPVGAAVGATTTAAGMSTSAVGENIGSDALMWAGRGVSAAPGLVAGGAGIYNWASSLGAEAAQAGTTAASTAASAAAESAPDVFEAGLSSVHHMGFSEADAAAGLTEAARNAKSGEVVSDLAKSVSATGAGAGAGEGAKGAGVTFSDLMTYGGWAAKGAGIGWGLYSGLKGADATEDEANAKAALEEENAKLTELSAENFDLRNAALEKAGDYEKEALLKRRRQIAGQARAAAAANGVMLEGRAESSPSMFEQDVAAEAQYEIGKIASDVRTKQAFNDISKALTLAKAANQRYGAGVTRSLGNMRASSERLNAWANAGFKAAELGFGIGGSLAEDKSFADDKYGKVKSLFA